MKSFGSRAHGLRLERMAASPNWAGSGFRNVHPVLAGLRDPTAPMPTLREFFFGGEGRVPAAPRPLHDPRAAWARAPQSGLRATWLGHSTVLLEIDGHRVLTDPVFGLRASPSPLFGPKRFHSPPVPLAELPEVDAIVVSHDHYDHLDYPTMRALRQTAVPIVTALGVGAHLQGWGIAPERIHELDWWQTWTLPDRGLTLTATPSQHFSGRRLHDKNPTLWMGVAIAGPRHRVFFSGDTGLTLEYAAIRERLGPFDLVMLEVGAFHPAWGDIHLGPANALKAFDLLGGAAFLPVHWATFALAMHPWAAPADEVLALAGTRPLWLPRIGEPIEPAHTPRAVSWWRGVGGAAPAAPQGEPPPGAAWPLD